MKFRPNSITDFLGMLFTAFILLWLTIDSSYFLKPIALHYDQETETMTLTREVTLSFYADYHAEIVVVSEEGFQCEALGTSHFRADEPRTIRFEPSDSLKRCLNSEGAKTVNVSWNVLFFGVVPLRPVFLTTRLL